MTDLICSGVGLGEVNGRVGKWYDCRVAAVALLLAKLLLISDNIEHLSSKASPYYYNRYYSNRLSILWQDLSFSLNFILSPVKFLLSPCYFY